MAATTARYFVKAADAELLLGNVREARVFAERAATESPDARDMPRGVCATTIVGCARWDEDRDEAERRLDHSAGLDRKRLDEGDESSMPRYDLAAVNAIRGNKADACAWLHSAIEARWRTYCLGMRDPLLRNLCDEPPFVEMMATIKKQVEEARRRAQDG